MAMGMVTFIVEGGVPPEVTRWDVHGICNFVAMGAEQIFSLSSVIVAQPLGILPL